MNRVRTISAPKQEYEFQLFGISTPMKDYQLAWEFNRVLKIDFCKKEYSLSQKKEEQEKNLISYYEYKDTNYLFRLFQNKVSQKGIEYLIPEMKSLDFILFLSGTEKEKGTEILQHNWKNSNLFKGIVLFKNLSPAKLKSIDNILW
ncbi:MAG: hypothetical protein A3H98_04330 [Bacteroidetes bacterium RIFCSPLOWO2_02_FULL_36_8]|nr:MAG: hypothetical protein A3H98_04330 [Bacteroidetes bacterium RIFCSPLOWO2_02_FULL_36_8]OFY68724.1 MAG: hypothetical protein A3G23_02715 [Bacteroidetes bacterium RIFCSPLOWO2_12_FULL_37_12]